ncbi:transposase [Sphingomonas psychrotolerans]|uniref:Transposase n=1 Tax=Sphingomonas psychrotolerans TaxID=1327635 RepID=A0ABU3N8F5_9SPHN|nr:transposase [Sphingomonas psychrotolerans]MDT8759781.1 transposase [Sphingomonas psychrotolerans]
MSLNIAVQTERKIGLEEFQELYRDGKYDARDADSLAAAAELLLALSNDKAFLADLILDELTNDMSGQRDNFYGPTVLKLGHPTETTVMRANIWAAATDEDYRRSPNAFIYGVPHDHNFNFLTVGYWGPGYKSRYYEFDYEDVEGYTGEALKLREVSFKSLEPDSVMLYRAHHDIHSQLPPDKLSISVNIMDSAPQHHYKDQYMFNGDAERIAVVLSSRCSPTLFEVAASFGDPEIQEALVFISKRHQSDYTRACALRSALRAETDAIEREKLIAYGLNSNSGGLRETVNRFLAS